MHLHARGQPVGLSATIVGRIATDGAETAFRKDGILLRRSGETAVDASGCAGVLSLGEPAACDHDVPGISHVPALHYLEEGDVVALHPSGLVEVLFRRRSAHNTFLVTERCNSLCIMCSQPPKDIDDSWRAEHILRAIDLIDPSCCELGFTGGEPTLLGDRFFEIVQRARDRLPSTAVHILTNGRRFADARLARRLGDVEHPHLMLGVPLYSDIHDAHDFVVQAKGAFAETIDGLYNLAQAGVAIELRMVLHASTVGRLPQFAEFVARHLPFVDQVALMGLEMFGYVHRNLADVWIDPSDYQEQLEQATFTLALHGMRPVIFNHQLCVLRRALWPFAVKSISDWKNVYVPACDGCLMKLECGGFFHSGTKRHSAAIRPFTTREQTGCGRES